MCIRDRDYAITSSLRGGMVENCYCKNDVLYRKENWYLDESLSGVHGAALRPADRFNYKYTLENGQVTWLLNNGEGTSTNYTCLLYTSEQPNAQLLAYQRIIKPSTVVLAVYDPDLADGSAEDKAVSYALALGRPVMLIHPETLKTKWLNVPTEKAPG